MKTYLIYFAGCALIAIGTGATRWLIEWWLRSRRDAGGPGIEPVRTIGERELAARFLNAPNHPLWEATLAALDLQAQEELDECLDEKLTNEQLRYRVGGVAGLLRFKANLQDRERSARLTESQSEQEAAEAAEGKL